MQVTEGTWRMREQCVPGSLSSSPAQEPGNEATTTGACFHFLVPPLLLYCLINAFLTACNTGTA